MIFKPFYKTNPTFCYKIMSLAESLAAPLMAIHQGFWSLRNFRGTPAELALEL
jgi:hypothetical protein